MQQEDEHKPGIREQHLLRRNNNPLFDVERRRVDREELALARLDDGREAQQFMSGFQALVQRAMALGPHADSQEVLDIKSGLDRAYQQACALPGDQTEIKRAIVRLVDTIMHAIRRGIGNDALARRELDDEEAARRVHFSLQELPLVSALTHPESPIAAEELIPSILSEPLETLAPSLTIFDRDQLEVLCQDARAFLGERDPQHRLADAWRRLDLIENLYHRMQQGQSGAH
ncbi:MAG TPA: hypothetical protein ENJ79_04965 [Gammaproteobacteria bacterium]|nr:hypothetical protein [Gammaproteobacteria bacterium]